MTTTEIKIKRYHNKKGNSYKAREEQECLDIICKKLKISNNPPLDDNYVKNILKYQDIEKQVKQQYDCNLREITFKIN
jgi:hypothetical protein